MSLEESIGNYRRWISWSNLRMKTIESERNRLTQTRKRNQEEQEKSPHFNGDFLNHNKEKWNQNLKEN